MAPKRKPLGVGHNAGDFDSAHGRRNHSEGARASSIPAGERWTPYADQQITPLGTVRFGLCKPFMPDLCHARIRAERDAIMRTLAMAVVFFGAFSFANGQGAHKPELFTSYFRVTTPVSQAYIPAETCGVIITLADKIVVGAAPDGLKAVDKHDLETASLNLRACATLKLARADRDLAVGLYGEVVSEIERRERGGK
jgi:hypothetical protein